MIPRRLFLKNFMGHYETDLDFTGSNVFLIVGRDKNNDRISNATGKSTIFKAIDYVLFGVTPSKKLERIVRDGQDQCEVIFEFEEGGTNWQISRKRSNKSNKTQILLSRWDGSEWTKSDHRTASQTEDAIKDLLKISYSAFSNSILFEQGTFSAIAEATDGDRRKLLKEPLSLSIYSKYEKAAKLKANAFDADLSRTKAIIDTLGDPNSDIISINKQISDIVNQISVLDKERIELRKKIDKDVKKASDLEKLLTSDAVNVAENLVEIDKQKAKCTSNISKLQQQALQYKNDIEGVNKLNTTIDEKLVAEEELNKKLQEINVRTDAEVVEDLKKLQQKEDNGNTYLYSITAEYNKLNQKLPDTASCPVCFNELNDEYREKISNDNQTKAEKLKIEIDSSKEKLKILKNKKEKLNNERSSIIEHNQKVKQLKLSITSLQERKEQNQNHYKKLEEAAKRIIQEATDENNKLKELIEKEKELQNKSNDVNISDINTKIVEIKSVIRRNEQEEKTRTNSLFEQNAQKGALEERLRKRTEDIDKLNVLNSQISSLENDVRLWNRVVRAFSTSGIPTLIIHTILDDLQIEANNILQELRPSLSLQFFIEKDDKDALGIMYKDNNQEREYALLSGGQKMYISFALRLGLSLVIQKRLGVEIKFLELDEVDQPLDLSGQDAFVDAIKKYQNKFKIFVITHNERLKNKFNNAIVVEGDGTNGSSAKVVQW
jgi:DNA repair exonuclease SbcCD ATPase subunit